MPYITLKSTAGVASGMITLNQLQPNTAQRNPILDGEGRTQALTYLDEADGLSILQPGGAGQPQYLQTSQGKNGVGGLAAYLIDNIGVAGGTGVGTATMAFNCITAIQAAINNGTALDETAINLILAANFGGGTSLTAGASSASVADILEICAGRRYLVPSGKAISSDENNKSAAVGGFVSSSPSKKILSGQDLTLSMASGEINGLQSASVNVVNTSYPYRGGSSVNRGHSTVNKFAKTEVESADMITIYDDDGSVLD